MAFFGTNVPYRNLNYACKTLSKFYEVTWRKAGTMKAELACCRCPHNICNSQHGFSTASWCSKNKSDEVTSLFIPVPFKVSNNPDDINVGEELSGKLKKG